MFKKSRNREGRFVAGCVTACMLLFIFNTFQQAFSQSQKKNEIKKEENFNRPERKTPIKPQIPSVNRYQDDKVFLEYADSLYKMRPRNLFDTLERQILKGSVKFRQGGMWMYCDSAYYYPEDNSLDAFSNVRMEQGDTLFVYADKLFYNGNAKMAYLKNGPTRAKVKLINRDVTLTTDSLDYDLNRELGWYSRWGTIDDKINTLTSLYGEYSPKTKKAEFYHDVVLVNNKDGYTMLTDTLHYNTQTHIADIDSRTEIRSENDTIITTLARYYTDTGNADLMSRSIILHRDSAGNVTTLEGDSIIYDNETRISNVFMFRDIMKRSFPMVLTDTAQKTTLIGGFGQYNDRTKEALATIYPLLIEYSQGDSIFLRADTIKTFTYIEKIPVYKFKINTKSGYPEHNGVPVVICDSNKIWIDTTYFVETQPGLEEMFRRIESQLPPPPKEEVRNEPLEIFPENSPNMEEIADSLSLDNDSVDLEIFADSIIAEKEIIRIDGQGDIVAEEIQDDTGPIPPTIASTNLPPIDLETGEDTISRNDSLALIEDVPDSIPKEFHIAYAYHRARVFKQDMQGVADSIVFIEKDSMLYMFRKPILWSGERQVTGNRIDVHFNDSTADWAYLPESGLISEHVDEDFYNQISGKEITAYFEGEGLRMMNVSGNVETIFLPQESDSTYNRLVQAESSYLDAWLHDNKMEKLKMWPEVTGSVTPIFLVKQNQKYLQRFRWWSFLRPQREWYGDRWHWADNLGEIPDELEKYFESPSDFGEPKSFPGKRPVPTASKPVVNIEASDSIPAILDAETNLTGEDIERNQEEMEQENRDTEEQSENIIEEITSEDPDLSEEEKEEIERAASEEETPAEENPGISEQEMIEELREDILQEFHKEELPSEEKEDE